MACRRSSNRPWNNLSQVVDRTICFIPRKGGKILISQSGRAVRLPYPNVAGMFENVQHVVTRTKAELFQSRGQRHGSRASKTSAYDLHVNLICNPYLTTV